MARAVQERVVAKSQHALLRGFAVCLERVGRGGLVKRQAEMPFAAPAVGQIPVAQREQSAAAEEKRIDEVKIEVAAIRVEAVLQHHFRRLATNITLEYTYFTAVVSCHSS